MDADDIRKAFEQRGIRKVKVGGFDVDGILRGKYITPDKFWSAVDKGFGFCDVVFGWDVADALYDNSKVTNFETGYPDALTKIDLSTFRILPYEPDTAHFLADFYTQDGKPHPACPRNLLKKVAARAETAGYRPRFAAEFEFWIFHETPQSLSDKQFRDLQTLTPGMFGYSWVRSAQNQNFVHDVLDTFEHYDVGVEGFHTETGPGVWEAAIEVDDVVRAADKAALFKTTMKQICHRHGLIPTFMAKWSPDYPGSSGHLHQSLFDADGAENLFPDAKAELGLSETARHYLGGLTKTNRELTALYSPFVNSYKRYVPGVWAPLNVTWGTENRTCGIRTILGPGAKATRIEYRQTAADINPYIAMATCLGAGLWGIENGVEPIPETKGDATKPETPGEPYPPTLEQAVHELRQSEAAAEILGEDFVDHYLRTRDWEVRQYRYAVTDWELSRYFEAV
ncbi:MAG: glutamine synthetase family protein [Polyangiales bacterium]